MAECPFAVRNARPKRWLISTTKNANVLVKRGCVTGTQIEITKDMVHNCFSHLFPTDSLTFQIRSKTKEIAVRDFINSVFEGFTHDKPLWTGLCDCTHRRRIDHRKLIGNTMVVIEPDENQHKSYNKMDEETRDNDLFMSFSGK